MERKVEKPITRREGKRFLLEVGLLCNFMSTVSIFIAFVSPYWIVSWPRVHSGFKRMGLWETCFSGLVLATDPAQKAYHGCWWILAPEYWSIRGWIMPEWFIFTQVAVTFCFVAEIAGLIIMFFAWITSGGNKHKKIKPEDRKPPSLCLIQTATIITCATGILMTCTCVIFAVSFKLDKQWLPNPYFNYPSWSFGMAVVSTFFSVFGMIAQVTHTLIVRQEMREPPRAINMSGYSLPSTKQL